MEKKIKSQKGKNKTSEGRKQLSSVRVIQRNLVYIVGLPLNLADEDVGIPSKTSIFQTFLPLLSIEIIYVLVLFIVQLLQRREYFSQYGKVLKVSISRTAAGAIQHFANNTCSV